MKALLIEKPHGRFQSVTGTRQRSGLSNCVRMLSESLDMGRDYCDSVDGIKTAIQKYRPKKVILQAIWVRGDALVILKKMFPDIEFYAHIHSNVPFLAVEGHAYQFIDSYYKNGFGIIYNSIHAYNSYKDLHPKTYYLPNIYKNPFSEPLQKPENEFLDVGCFGSIRPMKNHMIQALAALNLAYRKKKTLRFYTNFKRSESNGENVKKNLQSLFRMHTNHILIDQPWQEPSSFLESLKKMDVNLQVSMSESFNIVAADCVAAGTPLVVSPEIEWCSSKSMAKTNDPEDMISKMILAMSDRSIIEENQKRLKEFTNQSIVRWKEFLNE